MLITTFRVNFQFSTISFCGNCSFSILSPTSDESTNSCASHDVLEQIPMAVLGQSVATAAVSSASATTFEPTHEFAVTLAQYLSMLG